MAAVIPESPTTKFVKSFLVREGAVEAAGSASATSELGDGWIVGRPYPLGIAQHLAQTGIGERVLIERFLSSLDGRFSGIFRCRDGWVVATDVLGCGPIFWRRESVGYLLSTHMGPLVRGSSVEIDEVGCLSAALASICIGGRTPYRGVSRLGPSQYLLFDPAFKHLIGNGRYFDLDSSMDLEQQHPGDPLELAGLLEEAVARERAVDAIFLSGGLDSQAIALAIPKSHRSSVKALSYGGWRSPDRRNGQHVGRSLGFESHLIGPTRLRPLDYWDPIATLGGGQSGLQASQHVAGARAASALASCCFSGFLGDALTGHHINDDASDDLAIRRLGHADASTVRRLSALAPSAMAETKATFLEAFGPWRQLPRLRARLLANLHLRQSNYISGTFDLMHQEMEVATPFYYRPLLNYMLTRRDSDLREQSLYKRALGLMGYVKPDAGTSSLDRHARAVEARRGSYLTVDWNAVLARNAPALARVVAAIEHPLLKAMAAVPDERRNPLPRLLFVLPIAASCQPGIESSLPSPSHQLSSRL